ncbi:MAG: acyl carrier protein [Magnetococcales bacterium]|nr:acyl carrier protein [Magnetococcales bacterium]
MDQVLLEKCLQEVLRLARRLLPADAPVPLTPDTPLVGRNSPFKSRQLVELLVGLEEFCDEQLGFEFDWTSDSALSEQRSVYRSVGSLAEYVASRAPAP